jgi:hypothetical protein
MSAIINAPPGYWNGAYSLISNEKAALLFRMKRELKRRGLLSERGTLPVLTGNAVGAGGSVAMGYNRAAYGNTPTTLPGGLQAIETIVAHAGVTTAADETFVDSWATLTTQPTYVRNADGNPRASAGG